MVSILCVLSHQGNLSSPHEGDCPAHHRARDDRPSDPPHYAQVLQSSPDQRNCVSPALQTGKLRHKEVVSFGQSWDVNPGT